MTTLNLNDLNISQALDCKSMAELRGGTEWHLRTSYITTGPWSAYTKEFGQELDRTTHDGYRARHFYEGWKRTRTQTEYSYWDHFVKV